VTRNVIGIDASYTCTGVAVFVDGKYRPELSKTISTKPTDGDHVRRASTIADSILVTVNKMAELSDVSVFIEDYAYARMTNREVMGELGGIIKYVLRQAHHGFETLPISTIRKLVTGKGNAKKEEVMLALYKRHGIDIPQHDLADAAAVGITGDFIERARAKDAEKAEWLVDVRAAVDSYLKNKRDT